MTSYARRALRGTATVFILSLVSAFVAYLFRFMLARELTVEDYGLFFALFSFINLLSLFKDMGVGYALLKFIPELQVAKKWGEIKSLITSSFIIQLISSGIIALVLVLTANTIMHGFFHSDQVALLILFAAIFFVSFPQNILSICFQSFQRMFLFAVQDLSRNVIVLGLTFALMSIGLGLAAPALAYFAMYILIFALFFFIFSKRVFKRFWKVRTALAKAHFSSLLIFGLPAMLSVFGISILQYTDTLMLTYMTDLTNVGLYQVAVPLAALILYFAHATSAVATPLIAELIALKKRKELRIGMELLHKYLFIVVTPLAIVLIAFPEIFIRLFFGDKFLAAAPALQVLALGGVFCTIAYVNLNALFGLGKPRYATKVMLLAVLTNVVLNAIFIPHYGIVGAAGATSFSYLFMLWLSARGIKSSIRIREPWVMWMKTLLSALVLVALLAAVKKWLVINPWLELSISVAIGGLAYLLLLFCFRIVTRDDVHWWHSIVLKR